MDRIRTLTSVASKHPLRLYTLNRDFSAPGIENMGSVDYDHEMPYVFHHSKINLNITLKSIKSGIPLRAIDIMSAGGFLLTNFQADFLDYLNDLYEKIAYYLSHEEERRQIAQNGRKKVREFHSFEQRFREIFAIVFPN